MRPDQPQAVYAAENLVGVLLALGRTHEAVPFLHEYLERLQEYPDGDDLVKLTFESLYGRSLVFCGRTQEAEPFVRGALDGLTARAGEDHRQTLQARFAHFWLLHELGRHGEALDLVRQEEGRDVAAGRSIGAELRTRIGRLLLETGRCEEAEPYLRQAMEKSARMEPWLVAYRTGYYGACLTCLGRFAEAEPLLLDAFEALASRDPSDVFRRRALNDVIAFYESAGRPAEAAAWRARAGEH